MTTSPSECEHKGFGQVAAVFNGAGDFLALYWCPICGAIGERSAALVKETPGVIVWTHPQRVLVKEA